MDGLRKTLLLILIAFIPAAAPAVMPASPDLCFAAGSVTYRLSSQTSTPDYRVAIDNQAPWPDLRIRLVDRVEVADFALTDDAGAMIGSACRAAGTVKTVRVVSPGTPADITIAVTQHAVESDFSLYVYSARVSHADAAALFAVIRRTPAPDREELDGGDSSEFR